MEIAQRMQKDFQSVLFNSAGTSTCYYVFRKSYVTYQTYTPHITNNCYSKLFQWMKCNRTEICLKTKSQTWNYRKKPHACGSHFLTSQSTTNVSYYPNLKRREIIMDCRRVLKSLGIRHPDKIVAL
jgi:hypothetical protein